MMTELYSFAEYQQVYVACHPIFQGRNAKIRRLSKTKSVLLQRKTEVVKSIVEEMGEEKVANIALDLLREKVFKYETKARARFPGVFQTGKEVGNSVNWPEADRNASPTAEPLDDIFSSEDDIHVITTPDWDSESDMCNARSQDEGKTRKSTFTNTSFPPSGYRVLTITAFNHGQSPTVEVSTSLQPIQNSPNATSALCNTQRRILMSAQVVLNESCFEFMSTWIPKMLHDLQAPQCNSAGDFFPFTVASGGPYYQLPTDAMSFISTEATIEAFKSARFLQQTYSERSQISWREISEILKPAIRVAEGLRNNVSACKIRELRKEIDGQVEIRQAAKTALQYRVPTEMDDIRRQREELDKRERALIDDMAKEEINQSALLSDVIDKFLDSRFGKSEEHL
ncbi:hypothetical protein CKAH01_12301 [Colletotrichum kahawae]|uniref:Uncharacterized protein n=1 Tax=Colletotrichum kahawae TaxID=34407 RepID=A0AAD9YRE8_COLKA|nr:hypothetical protein CKAH01_12301 [Colletotrichum kahawae]